MKTNIVSAATLAVLLSLECAASALELKNDSFVDGASVGFQGGFVDGEIGAARFIPPVVGVQLRGVRLLFGGASGTRDVTIHVWSDAGMTVNPGAELFSGDFTLNASDTDIQFIDLSTESITISGPFRVGVEFQHSGLPSIARDADGTIAADKNFILASGAGWFASSDLGLTGDWIIHAEVSDGDTSGGGGTGGGGTGGGGTGGGTGGSGGSGSSGGEPGSGGGGPSAGCKGNSDCAVGEHCASGVCTFDCREDADCASGSRCNSLGLCVAAASAGDNASGDDGGCSTAPGTAGGLGGLFAAFAAAVAAERRKRRPARPARDDEGVKVDES